MTPQQQVLELELKAVRAIRLTKNRALARAALNREKALRLELQHLLQPRPRGAKERSV